MEIKREPDKDEICRQTCKDYDNLHSLHCPYTQDRWKQQGWARADQFRVATPREVREAKAA
jgi:hypothetical protein